MNNNFYVYVILDTRKKEKYTYKNFEFDYKPFYVGKGKDYRYADHFQYSSLNNSKSRKSNIIRKIIKETKENPIVVFLYKNISNDEALELEKQIICDLKRYTEGGILSNVTDGGENPPTLSGKLNGFYKRHHTDETKKIMRERKLGKKLSNYHREKLSLSHRGEKNGFYGRKHNIETKLLISKAKSHPRKKYEFIDINGNITVIDNLKKYCSDNKYNYSSMVSLVKKRLKSCHIFISGRIL